MKNYNYERVMVVRETVEKVIFGGKLVGTVCMIFRVKNRWNVAKIKYLDERCLNL